MEVTLDLVRERHEMPSTRDIARAADVAEGTVFRAFETKDALTDAVIGAVACPVPLRSAISAIDPSLPLAQRTLAATRLLMQRYDGVLGVLGPMGIKGPPAHHAHPGCPDPAAQIPGPSCRRTALVELFEPDADRLRLPPEEFVRVLRILCFGGTARHVADAPPLSPEAVTDLVLHGALRTGDRPPSEPASEPPSEPATPAAPAPDTPRPTSPAHPPAHLPAQEPTC